MSGHAPGSRHLLVADDALDEMRRCRAYLTVCELLPVAELPSGQCPPGCERPDCSLYCTRCVHEASSSNADARCPGASVTDSDQAGGR